MKYALVFVAALALVGAFGASIEAQGTDFSGTWKLDMDASQLPQGGFGRGGGGGRGGGQPGGGRGPGPGGFGGGAGGTPTVVVSQTPDVLMMEQQGGQQSRTLTYRLDGAESTNATPRGDSTTTSRWDGSALVTAGSQTLETPRGAFTMDMTERRALSADGQAMTVESTRTTPRGDLTTTLVYRKATS